MKHGRIGTVAAVLVLSTAGGCASSRSPSSRGFRTLDAVVVEREYQAPGTGQAGFQGSGLYFLVFEAKDGEATAHYRFPVSREQYVRYTEGTRVALVLADNDLREIRPVP